jgi:hypothetical protein
MAGLETMIKGLWFGDRVRSVARLASVTTITVTEIISTPIILDISPQLADFFARCASTTFSIAITETFIARSSGQAKVLDNAGFLADAVNALLVMLSNNAVHHAGEHVA